MSQKMLNRDLVMISVFDHGVEERIVQDARRTEHSVLDAEGIPVLKYHDAYGSDQF